MAVPEIGQNLQELDWQTCRLFFNIFRWAPKRRLAETHHSVPRGQSDDDHPFIVLTETNFSFRCIPVGIGTLLTGLGLQKKKHM